VAACNRKASEVWLTPVGFVVHVQVVLSSGDALVFGGKARDMVHSVPKIHPNTADGSCSSGDTRVSGLTELLAPAEKQKLASLIGQISPSRSQDTLSFRMNFNFRRK
jgi:hypothetical protein